MPQYSITVNKTMQLDLAMRLGSGSGVVARRYRLLWMGNQTEWRPLNAPDFRATIPSSFLTQVNATILLEYVSEGTSGFNTFTFLDQSGSSIQVEDTANQPVTLPIEVNVLGTNVTLTLDVI